MESILNTILGTTIAQPNTRIHQHSCHCGCAACQKSGSADTDATQSELNEELGWRQGTFFDEIEAMQFEASDGSDLVQVGGVAFAPLPRQGAKFYWPLVSKDPKNKLITYRKSNSEIRKTKGRAFLDQRKGYRHHMAVDLYAQEGDPVIACEDGVIRSFYLFYQGVYALFVDHGHVVINYGEVAANSLERCFGVSKTGIGNLKIPVKAGQTIAYVGKMKYSSMLHFEMYRPGAVKNERWCWKSGGGCKKGDTIGLTPSAKILNPTRYLFHLKNYGQVAKSGGAASVSSKTPITGDKKRSMISGFIASKTNTGQKPAKLLPLGTRPLNQAVIGSPTVYTAGKTIYLPIKLGAAGQSPVGVYLPSGFRPGSKTDVVLYLHGHKSPCGMSSSASIKTYWENQQFLLREKMESARKNVILVAPTLGPKSEPGWLAQQGGFDRFWGKVLDGLKQQQLLPANATLGNVLLSGHSGAGTYMQKIVGLPDQSIQNIREVWLFDALYFGKRKGNTADYLINKWASWAKQNPKVLIYSHYQNNGEPAIVSLGIAQKGLKNYVALSAKAKHCMIPSLVIGERIKGATFLQPSRSSSSQGGATMGELSEEFWMFPKVTSVAALQQIMQAATQSKIATYRWKDHGKAPIGYLKGMALVYARVYKKLLDGDAAALEMAKANTGNPLKDALAHYAPEFNRLGMNNDTAGVDTLRHLFVLMMGLGMRESGGKWCEGRDRSAQNTKAETAEAGLFQTSYNAKSASPILPKLFQTYATDSRGFLEVFQEGVKCRSYDLENFGTGNGKIFQELSKKCPAFAVEFTAVALRNRRKHWGPINRKNVELLPECDKLLLQVQKIIDASSVLL